MFMRTWWKILGLAYQPRSALPVNPGGALFLVWLLSRMSRDEEPEVD